MASTVLRERAWRGVLRSRPSGRSTSTPRLTFDPVFPRVSRRRAEATVPWGTSILIVVVLRRRQRAAREFDELEGRAVRVADEEHADPAHRDRRRGPGALRLERG